MLETTSGAEAVERIEEVDLPGAYHPLVRGGVYYADGVLSTDVHVGRYPRAYHEKLRVYAEARYAVGLPLVGRGRGGAAFADHTWAEAMLGAPLRGLARRSAVAGALVAVPRLATELLDALSEHAAALGTVAAAALAVRAARRK